MQLNLTEEQAGELRSLLKQTLGEMSHEIADTDNAEYRAGLQQRRRCLREVADALEGTA
jgi:hypothetical protein